MGQSEKCVGNSVVCMILDFNDLDLSKRSKDVAYVQQRPGMTTAFSKLKTAIADRNMFWGWMNLS